MIGEMIDKQSLEQKAEVQATALERLPPRTRSFVVGEMLDEILADCHVDTARRAIVAGFEDMLHEEQEDVLASLMDAVPSHRRADALLALLDGTSIDDEVGLALAAGLMHVGPKGRKRAFKVMAQHPDMGLEERSSLSGILDNNKPFTRQDGVQTDLSWAEADGRMEGALLAAEEEEAAQVSAWEARAMRRTLVYREAVTRLDAMREVQYDNDPSATPMQYRSFFGARRPPAELYTPNKVLDMIAKLISEKMAVEEEEVIGPFITEAPPAIVDATEWKWWWV